jgi:hypothetical protein
MARVDKVKIGKGRGKKWRKEGRDCHAWLIKDNDTTALVFLGNYVLGSWCPAFACWSWHNLPVADGVTG